MENMEWNVANNGENKKIKKKMKKRRLYIIPVNHLYSFINIPLNMFNPSSEPNTFSLALSG